MSLFAGNSSPKSSGRSTDGGDRPPRSETTLLGDASKVLAARPDALSRATPESDSKADQRSPASPSPSPSPGPSLPSISGPTPPDRCTNVVASGARWQGTITVDDSVRVDGTFSGEIRAKGTVHVSEGAQVDAKVRAQFVVISGTFKGEMRCDQRVDLLPHSRVSGELTTKVLIVQEGAVLDSKVQMTGLADSDGKQQPAKASKSAAPGGENGSASESPPDRETPVTPAAPKPD